MRHKLLIVLATIWLFFLFLIPRSIEAFNKNFIFLLDQGRDYLAIKDIAVNHKLTLIGAEVGSGMAGLSGLFHGPFYFYFMSIPFLLFDGDSYGGVLLMFLFGLLTVGVGFVFGKKVFGTVGAFLMAFFIAISPPLIAQSRFVWSPHPSSFFILLSFLFTYLAYTKKNIYLFLAAFFTGFLYNFEFAIAAPMSLTLVAYSLFLLRKRIRKYVYILLGFLLAYGPLILFELRHGLQVTRGLVGYLSHASVGVLKFDSFAFLHNFIDTFPQQRILPPLLLLIVFISGVIFFILREKKKQIKFFIFFLILLTLVTTMVSLFIRTHIFEYYLIHLNFVHIFLFSYLLVSSLITRNKSFQLALYFIFAIFLIYGTINGFATMKKDLSDYGGMAKIRGKIDAIDYIYQDAKGEKFGLLIFSPPVYTYPYDYIVWWHGQKKYHYIPHQNKTGLFYLLIEKDLSQPWTYRGWLETVVKTGKVIETNELPSGFIIQKRMGENDVSKREI